MKTRKHVIAGAGLLFLGASLALAGGFYYKSKYWQDPVDQWAQVKFSHSLHAGELGIECADCHTSAPTSEEASDLLLPKQAQCADCHDVEDATQCTMCHVAESPREAYWAPERELVFSHKLHAEQGVACGTCHAGIETATAPSTAFLPVMTACQSCHDGAQQRSECQTCHTSPATLIPVTHEATDWRREHKRFARLDQHENKCTSCHTEDSCQECHTAANVQTTKGAAPRFVPENRPLVSGKQLLVKQSVHELNYRFLHPLDVRSRRSDCSSCHEQRTFCADCHSKNQEAGFNAPRPESHRAADFVRIGVGSGGGLHAELAERDIEQCAACHDVEGRDPACLLCHMDRTPGRGNDPKTHPARFRLGKVDHPGPGSTCFDCHTDSGQAGVGFCGYCHGVK